MSLPDSIVFYRTSSGVYSDLPPGKTKSTDSTYGSRPYSVREAGSRVGSDSSTHGGHDPGSQSAILHLDKEASGLATTEKPQSLGPETVHWVLDDYSEDTNFVFEPPLVIQRDPWPVIFGRQFEGVSIETKPPERKNSMPENVWSDLPLSQYEPSSGHFNKSSRRIYGGSTLEVGARAFVRPLPTPSDTGAALSASTFRLSPRRRNMDLDNYRRVRKTGACATCRKRHRACRHTHQESQKQAEETSPERDPTAALQQLPSTPHHANTTR